MRVGIFLTVLSSVHKTFQFLPHRCCVNVLWFAHLGSGSCEGRHLELSVVLLLYCWGTRVTARLLKALSTQPIIYEVNNGCWKMLLAHFSDLRGKITARGFVGIVNDVFSPACPGSSIVVGLIFICCLCLWRKLVYSWTVFWTFHTAC